MTDDRARVEEGRAKLENWQHPQPIAKLAKRFRGREWVPLEAAEAALQWWQKRDFESGGRIAELEARTPEPSVRVEAYSYAAWQQKRGILADTIDWAILEYDEWMKDDHYDARAVLDRIIAKLRERREPSLAETPPSAAMLAEREACAAIADEEVENRRASLKRSQLDNFLRGQLNAALRIAEQIRARSISEEG